MHTIVYIDGYNLYYGCLRKAGCKWIDLFALFQSILRNQDPTLDLIKIKFFTADVKANFSLHGQAARQSQDVYHNALLHLHGERIEIIKGYYTAERTSAPRYATPPDKQDRVNIWRLEEKQTDVLIAIEMYRDAVRQTADCLVLCTNDTDLEPGLRRIAEDSEVQLGIVIPRDRDTSRPANQKLSRYAAWTRSHILEEELTRSLLPEIIPRPGKKPIRKPPYW